MVMAPSGSGPRQQRDQEVVVRTHVGDPDDQEHADDAGARGQPHAPPPPRAVGPGRDLGDRDEHRELAERAEVVDAVERGDELLGQHHGRAGHRSGQDHAAQDQVAAVAGRRLASWRLVVSISYLVLMTSGYLSLYCRWSFTRSVLSWFRRIVNASSGDDAAAISSPGRRRSAVRRSMAMTWL